MNKLGTNSRFLVLAACLGTLIFSGASTAQAQTVETFTGLQQFFKQVVTSGSIINFGGQADSTYLNMPGAGPSSGAYALVVGQGSLISVRFSAESQCSGGGADAGWCGLRVLVDGVEASPGNTADYAFDSTNNGAEGSASWQGHSMDRHRCVRNDGTPRVVPVQVQWRVFSGDGNTTAPTFRLDDWSLTIESSVANCQQQGASALEGIQGLP